MNRIIKRAVSLVCVLLTLCSLAAFPASAAYEKDLPIIYLVGMGEPVYDKSGNQVWPIKTEIEDILLENSGDLISAFGSSLVTSNWTTYGKSLKKAFDKYYSPAALDKNGNAKNGTDIKHSVAPKKKTSNFALFDYQFRYDPRLDPWETAVELSEYVNAVLKATGKTKVNFVGRCMGSCFVSAYLCRYGSSKVDTCIFYVPAVNGATNCSQLFAGRVHINSDTLNNYATNYMGGTELDDMLASIIKVTYSLNMLGMGTDVATQIFNQLALESFPELLLSTYATMPAFWAMVSAEYYDEAKNFIFAGREAEYAGLIQKIDRYHENVKLRIGNNLKTFVRNGMKFNIISKYNVPMPPYLEGHALQGDGVVNISDLTFGGTGVGVNKTLSVDYLNAAKQSGTIDYVSDDVMIDSSTGLFPNYTWYVRDIHHDIFPASIDSLMLKVFHTKNQVTVRTYDEYPQFMSYDSTTNKLSPVTEPVTNGSSSGTGIMSGAWQRLLNIFLSFFRIIKNLFSIIK